MGEWENKSAVYLKLLDESLIIVNGFSTPWNQLIRPIG